MDTQKEDTLTRLRIEQSDILTRLRLEQEQYEKGTVERSPSIIHEVIAVIGLILIAVIVLL